MTLQDHATQARLLLGPAGSGKTFRCLAEVREVLLASPKGPALLFLAPKQATFQLERQLLAGSALAGYTRLQILSFERLAEFILRELLPVPPVLLNGEGRTMVLRALLARKRKELSLFHASARLPGFAQQLSLLLRELQRHQVTPGQLRTLSANTSNSHTLAGKLSDLAMLFAAYQEWLKGHDLLDADSLLDLATGALDSALRSPHAALHLGGIWLDGFAEMTPQELALVARVVPLCETATLAFCLESQPKEAGSWLSPWSVVTQSYRRCYHRLIGLPGVEVRVEVLARRPDRSRYAESPVLMHLERSWTKPAAFPAPTPVAVETHSGAQADPPGQEPQARQGSLLSELGKALRVVVCANPTAEARLAAREILRHVRAGGRYRDCAVLFRSLEGYHDVFRRVFGRYEIPFFLDRREPVTHHPLAELTRNALRTVAFHWRPQDWFDALKSGLVRVEAEEIDRLENEALARGWQGDVWLSTIPVRDDPSLASWCERLRRRLVPPFERLGRRLGESLPGGPRLDQPTGADLAAALGEFWSDLGVSETLEEWSSARVDLSRHRDRQGAGNPIHLTVWQQMSEWLDNVAVAFPTERLSLREWLPILEAGLGGLTAGVVPPALDQVLIGAIDRSRNPELQLVLLPGLSEGLFPAKPLATALLSGTDREDLAAQGLLLGPTPRQQLAQERYYGYIAFTRARSRLVVTCSARDAADQPLNPSPFILHLRRLFPGLVPEQDAELPACESVEHSCELVAPLWRGWGQEPASASQGLAALASLPVFTASLRQFNGWATAGQAQSLSPALAEHLYGMTLRTSVSRLEQFAACPFRFFVSAGLLAEERQRFEADVREQGSFQHEVLARFHEELQRQRLRWRDLTPQAARVTIGRIASELAPAFREGLFGADQQRVFTAASLTTALQDFIETIIAWMEHYGLDPHSVELAFGTEGAPLPAWELELGDGHRLAFRGLIDRVDLAMKEGNQEAWCVVVDYKSGARKVDPLLQAHGIQIQLPVYLAALCRLPDAPRFFGVAELVPAGFFYVSLRGRYERARNRLEALQGIQRARRSAYCHRGRFRLDALRELDRLYPHGQSGQFSYRVTSKGQPDGKYRDLVAPGDFRAILDQVEGHLVTTGKRIFAGEVNVDPYRRGSKEVACNQCVYGAICRIDPWRHQYRVV